jgi:predicted DNA binding protein
MKLKRRRFETVADIQTESQAVLDSINENDFHGAFEVWKKDGITVYVPKETILKETAAKMLTYSRNFLIEPPIQAASTEKSALQSDEQVLLFMVVTHI